MAKAEVVARVLDSNRVTCQVVTQSSKRLTLTGDAADMEPTIEGLAAVELAENRALVLNAWAFAKFTHGMVTLPNQEEQQKAKKLAEGYRDMAEWIAGLVDDLTAAKKSGWCSSCFVQGEHQRTKQSIGRLPAFLCCNCGSPTSPCAGPRCENMAVRTRGGLKVPRYCAEHRHDIPGFEKANRKMESLQDYKEFLKYEKLNLSGVSKVVGFTLAGIALIAPTALIAAPAIGGAIGVLYGGFSGAVATSYGLALLGGGAVAAGGLGMAGGTLVVTALGAALGGVLGGSVMNAYVREDKSFHIELLRGGSGVPVVVCNGFLSEGDKGWGEWKEIVSNRYPGSPVYRVHWGAKELKNLGALVGGGAFGAGTGAAIRKVVEIGRAHV